MNRPSLILLVGIPGSGKTTYAEKYIKEHENTTHISSDQIRAELFGNEATQGDNNEVFSLMQARTIDALSDGKSVVYDATNITRKDRSYIIALCPKFVKIECHIVWAPISYCIYRDEFMRKRTVGKSVIDKMLKRFQAPYYDEGIDEIKIIMSEEFDVKDYESVYYYGMKIPHDNPHHTLNIFDHCAAALQHSIDNRFGFDVAMAAIYHDVGKPYVKDFIDNKGNWSEHAHYYQHQCVGAWISYGLDATPYVAWLISTHMDPFLNTKYYNKLPAYLKNQVDLLHEADLAAH